VGDDPLALFRHHTIDRIGYLSCSLLRHGAVHRVRYLACPVFPDNSVNSVGDFTRLVFPNRPIDSVGDFARFGFPLGSIGRVGDFARLSFPNRPIDGVRNFARFGFPLGSIGSVRDVTCPGIPHHPVDRVGNLTCPGFPYRTIYGVAMGTRSRLIDWATNRVRDLLTVRLTHHARTLDGAILHDRVVDRSVASLVLFLEHDLPLGFHHGMAALRAATVIHPLGPAKQSVASCPTVRCVGCVDRQRTCCDKQNRQSQSSIHVLNLLQRSAVSSLRRLAQRYRILRRFYRSCVN